MAVIKNWRDVTPVVAHESAIVWALFRQKTSEADSEEDAPFLSVGNMTLHAMQAGKNGDYHVHENKEQFYYITRGRGKMKIDGKMYEIREGDAIHIPPGIYHQMINDSDDWCEHLIISGVELK